MSKSWVDRTFIGQRIKQFGRTPIVDKNFYNPGKTVLIEPLPALKRPTQVTVKILRGAQINPLGHVVMKLKTKNGRNVYIGVDKAYSEPIWMNESDWRKYAREFRLMDQHQIKIPDPDGLLKGIKKKMPQKFLWVGGLHDCMHFVDGLLRDGGVEVGYYDLWFPE